MVRFYLTTFIPSLLLIREPPPTSMGKKILIPLVIGQKISALKPPKIKKNVF